MYPISVMTTWDYGIVIVYLLGITIFGAHFMRGQKETRDFFLAGRAMGWLPVGISIMATNFSGTTLLGVPGYIVAHDTIMLLRNVCFLFVPPAVIWLFLRFFYRLQVTSVYEYIGKRFDAKMRYISSGIFLLLRGSWMATAQYALGLALTQALGIELWVCILIVGGLVAVYSSLGGIKGDIWTDVIQAAVMVGGIILTIALCVTRVPGGFGSLWELAEKGGRIRFVDTSLSFYHTTTLSLFMGTIFGILASYGVDQVIVQRFFTTKDYRTMVRSVYAGFLATLPVLLLTTVIGICIYGYFIAFPGRLPAGLSADQWFPAFIVGEMPVGVTGLFIACLLATTMSSTDSGVNCLTTVFIVDLYRPWQKARRRKRGEDDIDTEVKRRRELRLARGVSFGVAGISTIGAVFVGKLGTIIEIINKLNGPLAGVLLGIFFAAILSTRTNAMGALLGSFVGGGIVSYTACCTPINFFWYGVIGSVSTLAATQLASRFFAPPEKEKINGLTIARCNEPLATGPAE